MWSLLSKKDSLDGPVVKATRLQGLNKGLLFSKVFLALGATHNGPDTSIIRTWKWTSVPATGHTASGVQFQRILPL